MNEGSLLAKKYLNAVQKAMVHAEELSFINDGLPTTLVQLWMAKITTWEDDRNAPNPYYIPATSELMYMVSYHILTLDTRGIQN